VHHHSSQPWSFPANTMPGFYAAALSIKITIDYGELQDARWFERAWLLVHRASIAKGDRPQPARSVLAVVRSGGHTRSRLTEVAEKEKSEQTDTIYPPESPPASMSARGG
jgi:hypothetical protein